MGHLHRSESLLEIANSLLHLLEHLLCLSARRGLIRVFLCEPIHSLIELIDVPTQELPHAHRFRGRIFAPQNLIERGLIQIDPALEYLPVSPARSTSIELGGLLVGPLLLTPLLRKLLGE
ncbi:MULTISPECIES: hypothetical protein [unclassified Leucobacter]|uniref:hypothetical protein n=1 Tax=unclassified Leucobacter TaxID=2621730 RepID=UPI00165E109D|nr:MULTISPECIES: hypothetical protein [unclassified Leucobacter]MBC9926663.1 hypothetical protein [Leucobacter sp. cx-169]MBC9935375.1 hypothetical protein [Leucobacter sp. cx-87]